LEKANVNWFLSINPETLPVDVKEKGIRTYRSINIDNDAFEFSSGFTDLHTDSYDDILNGGGYDLDTAEKAIQIVYDIRNSKPVLTNGRYHPMVSLPLSQHPFEFDDHMEEILLNL
jgi:UDP-N-acetyl-2-amino-2-deoxyglucuronate dehydrogenase